ncbi:hypothetical protein ANCCAN_18795 [Ancylostoma caninum]|uniref:Uncharacterized protein n=1 Tax=Ancylostoma caninum TaxID=29170 RepID=A0A368FYG5_ANCCA|nr:hypothetical protein ANCCAN_18795 [Ancylostoma caninum]
MELDRNCIALKARMSPMTGNQKVKLKSDLPSRIDRKMAAPILRLALTPEPPPSKLKFDLSGPPKKHNTSTAAMSNIRTIVDTILKFLMMSAPILTVKSTPMRSYQTLDTVSVDLIGPRLPRPEEDKNKWKTEWKSHQQLTQGSFAQSALNTALAHYENSGNQLLLPSIILLKFEKFRYSL